MEQRTLAARGVLKVGAHRLLCHKVFIKLVILNSVIIQRSWDLLCTEFSGVCVELIIWKNRIWHIAIHCCMNVVICPSKRQWFPNSILVYQQGCRSCCSLAAGLQGNGERMRKWRGNVENMRKLRGNGERVRKWSARQNEREKEFHLCISLSLLQNIKKTLKYVTFCREMLKYGTFCRECRKNRNIRAMRKWFWIKSGCEEAPQVVPACMRERVYNTTQHSTGVWREGVIWFFFSSPHLLHQSVSGSGWIQSDSFWDRRRVLLMIIWRSCFWCIRKYLWALLSRRR